jgi:hypothetical protein
MVKRALVPAIELQQILTQLEREARRGPWEALPPR